jgi:RNA polymerase sigma factor (sigma-70 family)
VAKSPGRGVMRNIQALFTHGAIGDLDDEQLLDRFISAHAEFSELAFEVLMDRHGPMVLRVCREILRDGHDAEDAFQATFLVLARKAASIRERTSVASWLHGVARRVASRARSAACRRRLHERRAAGSAGRLDGEPRWDDLAAILHEEIDRLPERYRAPLVSCDLEGLTEGQASQRLGRPIGTVRSQLARGRNRLRSRLIRRGLAPAVTILAGGRVGSAAMIVCARPLVSSTVRAARQFAVARTTTAGMVPASAATLAEAFLGSMLMGRVKNAMMAVSIAIGMATAGALAIEPRRNDGPPPQVGDGRLEGRVDELPKAHGSSRPEGDARKEVLELVHAWSSALVRSDVGAMDRLLAYELIGTDPTGSLWDKAKYLEHVKTNAFHVESAEFDDTRIDVYGGVAVETGTVRSNVNAKRPPYVANTGFLVERLTRTWIRRHGSWQCVAFQSMIVSSGEGEIDPDTRHPAEPISKPD